MPLDDARLIDLPKITDYRGNLTFIEGANHVPFAVQRDYYVYDVPGGALRGGHAQRRDQEFIIAVYGSLEKNRNDCIGRNSRLDELQAAVLAVRLRHLDADNDRRRSLAASYLEALAKTDLALPQTRVDAVPVWHQFVVCHPQRDAIAAALAARGIQTMIHYPTPPHRQPACRPLGYRDAAYPRTVALHEQVLSLPIDPRLTDEEQQAVIAALLEFSASPNIPEHSGAVR